LFKETACPYTQRRMPARIVPTLAAYLWDLRSLCEAQLRALTDAQRQLDEYRDGTSGAVRTRTRRKLLDDLERVRENNVQIRTASAEALAQAGLLRVTLARADK
jgi:hypothetical protein